MKNSAQASFNNEIANTKIRLDRIISALPFGIFVVDANENVVYANSVAESVFGKTESHSRNFRCGDFIACNNRDENSNGCGYSPHCPTCPLLNAIRAVLLENEINDTTGEAELSRDDVPNDMWIKYHAQKLSINDQIFVLLSVENITDEKIQHARVMESEERFRASFMVNPNAVAISRQKDGVWIDVNPSALDMFGYEREEVIGTSDLSMNIWVDTSDRKKLVADVDRYGETKNRELLLRRKDGSVMTASVSARGLTLKDEKHLLFIIENITEQKKVEKSLLKSEKIHQSILQTATDGFWQADGSGRCLEVNKTYCDMSGYEEQELLSMKIPDLECVESPEEVAIHMKRIISEGQDRFESRHRRKDGSVYDVEVSAQYIPDEGGRVVCFLRDITEQKRNQEKLVETLSWYQEIFEGSKDAIFISDEEAYFTSVNAAACELTGFEKEELLNMGIPDLHDMMDLDAFNMYHARIMSGESIVSEAKILRKDGEKIDTEFSNRRIFVSDRPYMHTTARDIRERKKTTEKIEELNQRFKIAADSAAIGVWELNLENNVLTWDDWMYRIYGINPSDFKGAYDAWKNGVHPQDLFQADQEVQHSIQQGKPFETSFRIIRPDGEIRYIKAHALVTRINDEHPGKMIGVNIDVTEQKQFETALQESEAKFRTLVDQAPAALFLHNMEGRIIDVNQAAISSYGYTREQLLKMTAKDIDPDYIEREDQGDFWLELEKIQKIDFEARHRRKDGSIFPVNIGLSPVILKGEKHIFALAIDMTENKRQKEELELKSMVLDQIHDHVTITDLNGVITYVNQAQIDSFGSGKDELIGQKTDVYGEDPEKGSTQLEILEKTLRDGEWRGEVINFSQDGSELIMDCRTQIIFNEKGSPTALCGIASDVTDYRRILERLRISEARYRAFFEEGPDGVVILDPETGKIVEFNDKACEQLGYSRDEFQDLCLSEIDAIESAEEAHQHIQKILHQGRDDFETRHVTKDGEIRWVHVTAQTVFAEDECIYHCIWRDVTERKFVENALKESEKKFRLLFENSTDAHVLYTGGRFIDCNQACIEMLGFVNKEQFLTLHPSDISPPYQKNGKSSREASESMIALTFKKGSHRFEWLCQKTDGSELILDVLLNVIKIKGEDLIHGVWRDVTKLEKLQEQILQAQKIESIGTLAGGIAHDFNNILFPIIGISEMLIEDFPSGSPEQENVNEILKAGKRGSELVKQILAFSRLSEHKLIPTRVQHILKEVLKLTRSTIPTNIEINQYVQSDCGMVMADPTQIHQIAMNIITNAYHAIEDVKEGTIDVQLREKELSEIDSSEIDIQAGRYAVLSISDNGHGMSPDVIDKIFDPYFTTKELGKGTGLGLAVVHGIVQEHKGTIKVYSELGKGTTFDVYFPLMDKPSIAESKDKKDQNLTGTERILLVDDEEAIARLEKQMLERMGYNVTTRSSSIDALEAFKVQKDNFDLVITDMSMPAKTGVELAKELISIRPDIPVIICTGYSEKIDDEKARTIGIKGLLLKPIVKAELAKMVRKVLDEKAQ